MTDAGASFFTVPVIVRIAGLAAETIAPLGSPECAAQALTIARLEDELGLLQEKIVDRLHERIEGAPPAVRRVLLDFKRDCHNGRPLSPRQGSPAWPIFVAAAGDLAAGVGELERALGERRAAFAATFDAEQEREIGHLLTLLDEDNLRQGLALASPEVLSNIDRLRKPVESYQRKERRLIQSLLRYVSRAALKLSPFSTLTRLGMATLAEGEAAPLAALRLAGARQRELLRIKKHVAIKYFTILKHYPPFRDRLQVQLNPSVEPVGSAGRFRFIKPFHWQLSLEAREFRYCNEDQVAANLRGPLIEELLALRHDTHPYAELVQRLSVKLGGEPGVVEPVVRKLIEAGFLLVQFPWPTNDFDPERTLLAFLKALPQDTVLKEFGRTFGRLLELRDAALPVDDRPRAYREIDELRLRGFHILTAGLGFPEVREEVNSRQLNEDVFLLPGGDRQQDAVASISRRSAEEALACARPMVLYSDLNYTRYEFLYSLGALAEKQWPGRREIGFLDLFQAAQPLWGDYVKASTASITEWKPELWNPFGREEILELKRLRDTVLREMEGCMRLAGNELVLDREGAERAVGRIPEIYIPAFGPCLFVQPAAKDADLWMLNHMLDGTGRFSNRYTTVMPEGLRERFSAHLGRGGDGVTLFGEPAEMIEILCSRDDHLNVHRVQTARVLAMPGENPALPAERRIGLRDLRVRFDGPMPVLTEASGRRLLPIFLGTNGLVGMPTLVRFLSRFGIGEFRLMHPPRPPQRRDGVTTFHRLRIGNLVLRRQLWAFSPGKVFARCAGATDAELFLAVDRWRHEHAIPDRVFVAEKVQAKFNLWPLHKPQYIDFTSPSFMPLLRAAFESSSDELKLEESLPMPDAFPLGDDGRRRACEAQLESIAFQASFPWQSQRSRSQPSPGQLQSVES